MDEPQNDYEESLKQAEAAAIANKGKRLPEDVSGEVDGEPTPGYQLVDSGEGVGMTDAGSRLLLSDTETAEG